MRILYFLFAIALCVLSGIVVYTTDAAAQTNCDTDNSCIGNALTIDVTDGKGAQYVDVDNRNPIQQLDYGLTFEAWIKPTEQPGKRQYIAGLWGPNQDNNDQWVMYIQGTQITFELNSTNAKQGNADNTIATADIPSLYTRGWLHIGATWDSGSTAARIFVDGTKVAEATNPGFPLKRLHTVQNNTLQTQIGSCNSLYDNQNFYRSFLGQMDEIRIWNRGLSESEMRCIHLKSLQATEAGLILYFRCNDNPNTQNLCDATGNNHLGRMRSGAHVEASNRMIATTYHISPATIAATLDCVSDTTFTFTLTDTSFCGNTVDIWIDGRDRGLFTPSLSTLTLSQNSPRTFTVRANVTITGDIEAALNIRSQNRCGNLVTVPLNFIRQTELSYSQGRLTMDTLFVGCTDVPYAYDTLEICNTTGRPMNIASAALANPTYFSWSPLTPSQTLPRTLSPGECWSVVVRISQADTTRSLYDTLRIASDDRCPGSGIVPVEGRTQDVLVLLNTGATAQVKSLTFGRVCPDQISDVELYQYRSLVLDTIQIDSIVFTQGFFGRRMFFPLALAPLTAYQATFVRFRPFQPGPQPGEMRVYTTYRGCRIIKTISLSGVGINVDNGFDQPNMNFGNVTIGKSFQQTVNAFNNGDPARFTVYLKVGDVFRITSNKGFQLDMGSNRGVNVEFRPRDPVTYYDTLCIFDQQCYGTICIPITGTGVFDVLSFQPPFLSMPDVIGCQCKRDSIRARNETSSPVTIVTAALNGGNGKFTAPSGLPTGTLQPGQTYTYVIEYCPDDLNDDRADQVFIDIVLSDGQTYQILVRGNSVVPKLYVTPLTTYGIVEAGWQKRDSILVENISRVPISIPNINVPAGYTIIRTNPPFPLLLGPRDSLWVIVDFTPTAEQTYNGPLTVTVDGPCPQQYTGILDGHGTIVKLQVPLTFVNYGLIKPCECAVREIPLPNNSQYIPITVDSIWIDGGGLPNANPIVFSWSSQQTGGMGLPYNIAPLSIDTLIVSFCPDIPATTNNALANAKIHIRASTPGWTEEFTTTLSGRRELNFQPNRTSVNFPATRVDVPAAPITVRISVPDQFTNPSGDSIIITNVTFAPDDRVFTAVAVNGAPLPWVIKRNERFDIRVDFTPRAPKAYRARMQLHTSFPCQSIDTTVLVQGTGFAPVKGLQMAFDTARIGLDTFYLATCDTLVLPIMTDTPMPQDIIDILLRIGYDTTYLQLLDVTSPYTPTATVSDTGDGARVYLKDAELVQAGEFAYVRFLIKDGPARFQIDLDQIDFDSDSLVLFKIIAVPDSGFVVIDKPIIAISPFTAFDTVNVKDCADRLVYVYNPGAIPVSFDSLSLPPGHWVSASSIPYPTMLAPGDSIELTVTFCAFKEAVYDTTIAAYSSNPCNILDTGRIYSVGYAPPFPMQLVLDQNPGVVDTIGGTIGDTIVVPINMDRDMPQTPIDVYFTLSYNKYALQYLDITSTYTGAFATESLTGLDIELPGCDSLKQGEITLLRFVIAVPDTVLSPIDINNISFTSDSAFWVKPVPSGDTGAVRVDARCNITHLNFRSGTTSKLLSPSPNPATGTVVIDVEFLEDANADLRLYNSEGVEVARLLDGSIKLHGGAYRVQFNAQQFPAGSYYCTFTAGKFQATEQLVIIR